jgi:membrane-bound lytic murein transglycosylase B
MRLHFSAMSHVQRRFPARWALFITLSLGAHFALGLPQALAHTAVKKKTAPSELGSPDVAVSYGARVDVMLFAAEVAQRQQLDIKWVQNALQRSRFVPSVGKFIMPAPAGTAKNWAAYRARFVEPQRVRAGLQFWQAQAPWLEQAHQRYGVPPEIVVGILGVETLYGKHMGNFRVIDALATLSFDFPSGRSNRSAFFRDELEQFLVMAHREGSDPLSIKGSFAGAMGLPQFMPSSVIKYGVDFDGDGHINLHQSAPDVIGSVARYLSEFGWQAGLPTHFEVAAPVDVTDRAFLLGPDIVPSFTAQEFTQRGAVLPPEALQLEGKLALVELQNGSATTSYVAGTKNFYAVTRYNWSSYYAMAVIALGDAVRTAKLARPSQK